MGSLVALVSLLTPTALAWDADTAAALPFLEASTEVAARAPGGARNANAQASRSTGNSGTRGRVATPNGVREVQHSDSGTRGRVATPNGVREVQHSDSGTRGREASAAGVREVQHSDAGTRGRVTTAQGTRVVEHGDAGTRGVVRTEGGTRGAVATSTGARGRAVGHAGAPASKARGAVIVRTTPVHVPVRTGHAPAPHVVHAPVRSGPAVVVHHAPRPVVVHHAPHPVHSHHGHHPVVVHHAPAPVVVHDTRPVHRAPEPERQGLNRAGSFALGARIGTLSSGYFDGGSYGDLGFGLDGRYRPTDGLGLALNVGSYRDEFNPLSERNQTTVAGSVQLFAFPNSFLQPYIMGGLTAVGRNNHDEVSFLDGSVETVDATTLLWGPHAGAGLEIAFGRSIALDLEARVMGALNRSPSDPSLPVHVSTGAGLLVHF